VLHEWPAIPVRKRQRSVGSGPAWLARSNWCTGIACSEDGSLFVSQYRVHGLLKFSFSPLNPRRHSEGIVFLPVAACTRSIWVRALRFAVSRVRL